MYTIFSYSIVSISSNMIQSLDKRIQFSYISISFSVIHFPQQKFLSFCYHRQKL